MSTGECGTHRESGGAQAPSASVRGVKQWKRHVLRFAVGVFKAHKCQYSSFPVAEARFRQGERGGRPVRNLKERWGIGTEAGMRKFRECFLGSASRRRFYKRDFEVIIKCVVR